MRHRLLTRIDIPATPDQVWRHLTDFTAYGRWNPFITRAEGTLEAGRSLTIRLEPPGGRAMTFRPRVTVVRPGSTVEWLGRTVLPGVFDGRHRFELTPIAGGTRLEHSETFRGLLVPLLRGSLDGPTRRGFEAMNRALADRAGHPGEFAGQAETARDERVRHDGSGG